MFLIIILLDFVKVMFYDDTYSYNDETNKSCVFVKY